MKQSEEENKLPKLDYFKVQKVVQQLFEQDQHKKGKNGLKKPTFPMDYILFKFPNVKKVLTELLTVDFRNYIENIYVIAPKPTTLKVVLKNKQSFLIYYNERSYIVKVEGRKYYLLNIGERERAIQSIADLLNKKKFTTSKMETDESEDSGSEKSSSGGGSGGNFPGSEPKGGGEGGEDKDMPDLPDLNNIDDTEIPSDDSDNKDVPDLKENIIVRLISKKKPDEVKKTLNLFEQFSQDLELESFHQQLAEDKAVEEISMNDAAALIDSAGSSMFTVEFTKKDGSHRVMNCMKGVKKHLKGGDLRYTPSDHGLVPVYDLLNKGYRMISKDSLVALRINGKNYKINPTLKEIQVQGVITPEKATEAWFNLIKSYDENPKPELKNKYDGAMDYWTNKYHQGDSETTVQWFNKFTKSDLMSFYRHLKSAEHDYKISEIQVGSPKLDVERNGSDASIIWPEGGRLHGWIGGPDDFVTDFYSLSSLETVLNHLKTKGIQSRIEIGKGEDKDHYLIIPKQFLNIINSNHNLEEIQVQGIPPTAEEVNDLWGDVAMDGDIDALIAIAKILEPYEKYLPFVTPGDFVGYLNKFSKTELMKFYNDLKAIKKTQLKEIQIMPSAPLQKGAYYRFKDYGDDEWRNNYEYDGMNKQGEHIFKDVESTAYYGDSPTVKMEIPNDHIRQYFKDKRIEKQDKLSRNAMGDLEESTTPSILDQDGAFDPERITPYLFKVLKKITDKNKTIGKLYIPTSDKLLQNIKQYLGSDHYRYGLGGNSYDPKNAIVTKAIPALVNDFTKWAQGDLKEIQVQNKPIVYVQETDNEFFRARIPSLGPNPKMSEAVKNEYFEKIVKTILEYCYGNTEDFNDLSNDGHNMVTFKGDFNKSQNAIIHVAGDGGWFIADNISRFKNTDRIDQYTYTKKIDEIQVQGRITPEQVYKKWDELEHPGDNIEMLKAYQNLDAYNDWCDSAIINMDDFLNQSKPNKLAIYYKELSDLIKKYNPITEIQVEKGFINRILDIFSKINFNGIGGANNDFQKTKYFKDASNFSYEKDGWVHRTSGRPFLETRPDKYLNYYYKELVKLYKKYPKHVDLTPPTGTPTPQQVMNVLNTLGPKNNEVPTTTPVVEFDKTQFYKDYSAAGIQIYNIKPFLENATPDKLTTYYKEISALAKKYPKKINEIQVASAKTWDLSGKGISWDDVPKIKVGDFVKFDNELTRRITQIKMKQNSYWWGMTDVKGVDTLNPVGWYAHDLVTENFTPKQQVFIKRAQQKKADNLPPYIKSTNDKVEIKSVEHFYQILNQSQAPSKTKDLIRKVLDNIKSNNNLASKNQLVILQKFKNGLMNYEQARTKT